MEEAKGYPDKPDIDESYLRQKRFYPIHVKMLGCIKGEKECCNDQYCRAFCSLCYGNYYNFSQYIYNKVIKTE